MEKIVLVADSNDENAREKGVPSIWHTVVHGHTNSRERAKINPWNQDEAIYEKRCFLMDDCVISVRPARYEDRIGKSQDYNKDRYFIEIANQDGSIIFSSHKVYPWDKVLELSTYFRGLSFTAATRVWKVKNF
jgi:hypothetical protein